METVCPCGVRSGGVDVVEAVAFEGAVVLVEGVVALVEGDV
jgi:hypothetical protein